MGDFSVLIICYHFCEKGWPVLTVVVGGVKDIWLRRLRPDSIDCWYVFESNSEWILTTGLKMSDCVLIISAVRRVYVVSCWQPHTVTNRPHLQTRTVAVLCRPSSSDPPPCLETIKRMEKAFFEESLFHSFNSLQAYKSLLEIPHRRALKTNGNYSKQKKWNLKEIKKQNPISALNAGKRCKSLLNELIV